MSRSDRREETGNEEEGQRYVELHGPLQASSELMRSSPVVS